MQWEVSYAIDHHIPVLALSLPGSDPDGKFGVLDDAFRLPIDTGDLTEPMSADAELTGASLPRSSTRSKCMLPAGSVDAVLSC